MENDNLKDTYFNNTVETENIFDMFKQGDNETQDSDLETVQDLYQTMALQMEYTESLKDKKDSRKLETVQFVEIDKEQSNRMTQKLIDIYGIDSIQVKKWTEQLQKIEYYKELQQKAIKKHKRQTVAMGVLGGIGVCIIIAIVIFVLNTNSYYINQGDYNYVYKKAMFSAPEKYLEESVLAMTKDKSDLYYIAKEDNKLYDISLKNDEKRNITEDKVSEFKIIGDYIYYINTSDKNCLYRLNKSSTETQKIYEKGCKNLSIESKNLLFIDSETGIKKILNTKDLSISE